MRMYEMKCNAEKLFLYEHKLLWNLILCGSDCFIVRVLKSIELFCGLVLVVNFSHAWRMVSNLKCLYTIRCSPIKYIYYSGVGQR